MRLAKLTGLLSLAVVGFVTLMAGQTHVLYDAKVFTGEPEHPYAEAVAISGEKVLTVGAHREVMHALNMLNEIGMIAPGKQADLVLVDRDLITVPAEDIEGDEGSLDDVRRTNCLPRRNTHSGRQTSEIERCSLWRCPPRSIR